MENLINPYLKELISNKPVVISQLLLNYYSKLGITEIELVVILQLIRFRDCLGDVYPSTEKLEGIMNLGSEQIKAKIARLIENGLLSVEHSTTQYNSGKSSYSFDDLWDKLISAWEEDKVKNIKTTKNATNSEALSEVYGVFEKEFGRFLSPIESSKIVQWCKNDGFSSELILEALERAVLQGALSFKYIDSILRTWANHNLKTSEDVLKYEDMFKNMKTKNNRNSRVPQREGKERETDKFAELYVT